MAILDIHHEVQFSNTPNETVKVFVIADNGTHHSTIASAVLKYISKLESPAYVNSVTLEKRAGQWSTPSYLGTWAALYNPESKYPSDAIRKCFASWPVPDYTN